MSTHHRTPSLGIRFVLAATLGACLLAASQAHAQLINQQVGGVSIDANGLVSKIQIDQLNSLKQDRLAAMQPVPGALQDKGLRKVSLRQLEAAIKAHTQRGEPLSDEMRYLAGIQRIQYVFVYPEQQDIVIAGPAEGWKLDALGEVVGETTNLPVLLLDDLLVALRSIEGAQSTGIQCSIEPTPEGQARTAEFTRRLRNPGANIDPILRKLEEVAGQRNVILKGVPTSSHFARVLLAADYRMKRIAMGFDESPIRQLPSYLQMVKTTGRTPRNMFPRWWLEPRYEAIVGDADGLAYEIQGGSVKCMTEDQMLDAQGRRSASGKTDPRTEKWAQLMTTHYDELAAKDSIFGQLRNCMDLAVLAALIERENLTAKAGWSMPLLMDASLPVEEYHAPQHVDSMATAVNKKGAWVLSISGGVFINPWAPLEQAKAGPQLAPLRAEAAAPGKQWWWN